MDFEQTDVIPWKRSTLIKWNHNCYNTDLKMQDSVYAARILEIKWRKTNISLFVEKIFMFLCFHHRSLVAPCFNNVYLFSRQFVFYNFIFFGSFSFFNSHVPEAKNVIATQYFLKVAGEPLTPEKRFLAKNSEFNLFLHSLVIFDSVRSLMKSMSINMKNVHNQRF